MLKKKKGFTLIELLVVIAIIGILSTLAIIALGNARAKARDAKRLSDVNQMATALEIAETSSAGQTIGGCTVINALTTTCTDFTEATNGVKITWSNFKDPSTSATATACVAGSTGTCGYSMRLANRTTANYSICFYLENASGSVAAGLNNISAGAAITTGCAAT